MNFLLTTFFLTLTVGAIANDQVLKICLTGSTEKALPKYGEAFVNGAQLAINELKGSDKGKVVLDVNYYDSNPLAPLSKLQELQKEACDAIIGFSTGNDLLSIESSLKASPILTMSIYGDPQARFDQTNYLRTFQPSANDLVEHLFTKLPFKILKDSKILLVTAADRSEMVSYKDAYLAALKDFPSITQVEVIEQVHDLRQVVVALEKSPKWDYVVLLTRSLIAAEVSDLIYQKSSPIILGTKYFGSSELPAFYNFLKNKKVQAYMSRQNCSCDSDVAYIKWRDIYKKAYSIDPMSISVDSYDATKFVLKSLKAPKLDKESVIKYLNTKESSFEGISSVKITQNLKLVSSKRFLIKIDETGYNEIK